MRVSEDGSWYVERVRGSERKNVGVVRECARERERELAFLREFVGERVDMVRKSTRERGRELV